MKTYSARYKDRFGEERTAILDDDGSLTMVVRGVRFRGRDFDGFEPEDVSDPAQLASFTFLHGSLCFCAIEADIALPIVTPTGAVDGLLTFELELGEPLPTGQMDRERLTLRLAVGGQTYLSDGRSGWFEDEMLDVQRKLPPGTFMKACINCAFSDYSPYGHGLFGSMICFRANKAGYLALPSGADFEKDAYFAVLQSVSEMVQETHLCPEFERRKPGTGYEGKPPTALRHDMVSTLKDIPPLLHDARLTGSRWDPHLKTLDLSFQCLRRNVDGTQIEDSTVDLKLGGVERVVADYSPASVTVRPSEFEPGSRTTLADLEEWPHGAVEAHLAINSPQAEFDAATACVREALVGDPEDRPGDSPLRVHVSFEPHNHGPQGTAMGLSIDCDSLEPFTSGVPLDIETWERQFEAWWAGWRGHWAAKGEEQGDQEAVMEDTFIPAGQPDPPDLSYRPPAAVPFLVPTTTTPAELLKPVEDCHTGLHERDWLKVAAAYPHFDFSPAERAARLRDQFLGWNHGRWVYVRHIDGWWREGDRACLVVRGIEHAKGEEEAPARNEETVITYGLRRSHQGWVIATWSQAWPRFGSADKLPGPQSWRDGWNLAD